MSTESEPSAGRNQGAPSSVDEWPSTPPGYESGSYVTAKSNFEDRTVVRIGPDQILLKASGRARFLFFWLLAVGAGLWLVALLASASEEAAPWYVGAGLFAISVPFFTLGRRDF